MGGTVLFVGAGASKPLNYPLTFELLPLIFDRLRDGTLFAGDVAKSSSIHNLFSFMFPALRRDTGVTPLVGGKQLPLITDVLSLLDHMRADGAAGAIQFGPKEIAGAREAIDQALFEVLVHSTDSVNNDKIWDVPPELMEANQRAVSSIPRITDRRSFGEYSQNFEKFVHSAPKPLTIISTNYDVETDALLFRNRMYADIWTQLDFGFSPKDPFSGRIVSRPNLPEFSLYKLHGSLNWLKCQLCGHVYINPLSTIAYLAFSDDVQPSTTCHCGFPRLQHLMVTPSFIRDIRDSNLLEVWRNALESLRMASKWYVLGYSLPPEDIAIRSLLLRAYHGREGLPPPEVVAVQRSSENKARFDLVFERLEFVDDGIEAFLDCFG